MIEIRCKGCNKLLAKGTVVVAAIKCTRCLKIYEYHVYQDTLQSNLTYGTTSAEAQKPKPNG